MSFEKTVSEDKFALWFELFDICAFEVHGLLLISSAVSQVIAILSPVCVCSSLTLNECESFPLLPRETQVKRNSWDSFNFVGRFLPFILLLLSAKLKKSSSVSTNTATQDKSTRNGEENKLKQSFASNYCVYVCAVCQSLCDSNREQTLSFICSTCSVRRG